MKIRHLVLQRFSSQTTRREECIALLRQKFSALPQHISGLRTIEFGTVISSSEYDVALSCLFDSMDAVNDYLIHPLHIEIKELSADWFCERLALDFEV